VRFCSSVFLNFGGWKKKKKKIAVKIYNISYRILINLKGEERVWKGDIIAINNKVYYNK
jgi:uncharacterized Zn finger protein